MGTTNQLAFNWGLVKIHMPQEKCPEQRIWEDFGWESQPDIA
jgi:hypothetical protein